VQGTTVCDNERADRHVNTIICTLLTVGEQTILGEYVIKPRVPAVRNRPVRLCCSEHYELSRRIVAWVRYPLRTGKSKRHSGNAGESCPAHSANKIIASNCPMSLSFILLTLRAIRIPLSFLGPWQVPHRFCY
jgi:hypothetical protein